MGKKPKIIIDPDAKRLPKLVNWMLLGEKGGKSTASAQFMFAADLIAKSRRFYTSGDCRMERDHWKLARRYIVSGLIQIRRALGQSLFDELDKEASDQVKKYGW